MHDITDGDDPARHNLIEPHQQSSNDKENATQHNGPEIKFLAAVEKTDVGRLNFVLVCQVLLDAVQPTPVDVSPGHRRKPIEKLKEEKNIEEQTEPRVQEASHRSTAEDRSQKTKEPWRVERKARQQGKDKSDRYQPVQQARVNRMA